MPKKRSTKEAIELAQKIHGNKYDYSKTEYISNHTKICIVCHEKDINGIEHGEFWQKFSKHYNSQQGCPKCSHSFPKNTEVFIKLAKLIFGNIYDYSKSIYINLKIKICIICPIHGEFWKLPNNHIKNKQGCPKCALEICRQNRLYTKEIFINLANKVHDNFYIYDKVIYKCSNQKVEIICPVHGSFWQAANDHLQGRSCPKCSGLISKSEIKIENWLLKNNINFIKQKKFNNCRGAKRHLPFDFYLPDYNMCIEFDGRQHFEPVKKFGGIDNFLITMKHDIIRNNYCNSNKIKLIRIPFWEKKNIDKILTELLLTNSNNFIV